MALAICVVGVALLVPVRAVPAGWRAGAAAADSVIRVDPRTAIVYLGDTARLVALDGRGRRRVSGLTWQSTDTGVATVTSTGLVRTRKGGTARIVASVFVGNQAWSDTATMTVTSLRPLRIRIAAAREWLLIEGDTLRLTAQVSNGVNQVLTGRPVSWSSSNPSIAAALATGLVRARLQTGQAWIAARTQVPNDSVPLRDSVHLRVLSLALRPESTTVQAGGTVQDTTFVTDSDTSPVLDSTLIWRTLDTTIARVSPTGLVSGHAPGVTRVSVRSRRSTGALVRYSKTRVIPDTTDGGPAGECLDSASVHSGWLWCDTFETSRVPRYFEYDAAAGRFVRDTGVGRNGSYGLRATFMPGFSKSGALKLGVGRTPAGLRSVGDTIRYRELFWRIYVRYDAGWVGGAGTRLLAATSLVNRQGAQAMSAYIWPGGTPPADRYLYIDPATGTDPAGTVRTLQYNDWANLRFLGAAQDSVSPVDSLHAGIWSCLEAHVRLNDSTPANGVFELWVNDTLQARKTNLTWVGAAYQSYGINAVIIENAWRTVIAGSVTPSQSRYFDNFVVSTSRISCAVAGN